MTGCLQPTSIEERAALEVTLSWSSDNILFNLQYMILRKVHSKNWPWYSSQAARIILCCLTQSPCKGFKSGLYDMMWIIACKLKPRMYFFVFNDNINARTLLDWPETNYNQTLMQLSQCFMEMVRCQMCIVNKHPFVMDKIKWTGNQKKT